MSRKKSNRQKRARRVYTEEFKPAEADDYPGQSDLLMGITMLPKMWQNALVGVPFDSARYSRYGERFCYLKIDGSGGLEESAFDDRAGVEEALNERLRPAALGSVVGGGTGLRYSYVELALTDVDAAWESIPSLLRDGRLPRRTWLLFHDDELGADWWGLYEETPSPPETAETMGKWLAIQRIRQPDPAELSCEATMSSSRGAENFNE